MSNRLVAGTWERPFTPPERMPKSADVVIVGGGIVGVSAAYFLARRGLHPVVCEKGHVAGEQSGRNWGWVRAQGRDRREMPMILRSLAIWRGLARDIGEDVGYEEHGCLFTASNEAQLADYEAWLDVAAEHGLDTRILKGSELGEHVRGASVGWPGAMYTSTDGRAEPHKAAPAIARAAIRNGATVLTACAVRGVDVEAGRVAGVVTEHGRIAAPMVLVAAGAWTSMFCRSLGASLPQLKVRGTVVRTAPGADVLSGDLFDERLGIRRRQDGGYTVAHGSILDHAITPSTFRFSFKFLPALRQEWKVLKLSIGSDFVDEWRLPKRWDLDAESPFESRRVLNPGPNPKVVDAIRRNIDAVFPALADADIVEAWAGMIETTPDVVPVIDELEGWPGLYVATGFSGHGFGIGPGAGYAIAGMLEGRDTGIDLRAFRLGRFFDGSPVRIESSV